jgi:hypothetical protein
VVRNPIETSVFALALIAVTTTAHATPSAKLTYVRERGAEQCPSEDVLRRAVAARLGYDPFFPWAKQSVITEIQRTPGGYRGRVRILDERGFARGERDLETKGDDCSESVNALALAISIGLDDLEITRSSEPPSQPVAPPSTSEPVAAMPPKPPVAPARYDAAPSQPMAANRDAASAPPTVPFVRAHVHGAMGTAPAPALGVGAAVGIRKGALSASVEGRADLPASREASLGTVSSSLYLVTLAPCLHFGAPFACALASGGSFVYAGSNVAFPRSSSAAFFSAGARFGAELPLSARFAAFTAFDVQGALTPHRITIDGVDVYEMPTFSGVLRIGLSAKID